MFASSGKPRPRAERWQGRIPGKDRLDWRPRKGEKTHGFNELDAEWRLVAALGLRRTGGSPAVRQLYGFKGPERPLHFWDRSLKMDLNGVRKLL